MKTTKALNFISTLSLLSRRKFFFNKACSDKIVHEPVHFLTFLII